MKQNNSFAKQRCINELELLRSNMEILPFNNQRRQPNSSARKLDQVERINFRVPPSLNYQNLLTFSFQKQNNKKLSFSNLKKSLKSSSSNSSNNCGIHTSKMAKYKEADSNRFYCKQCAIQVASKGIKVQQILVGGSTQVSSLIEQCSQKINKTNQILTKQFQKVKVSVNSQIKLINQYYTSIVQKISEMQIKDLLVFEACLQNAQKQYTSAKQDIEGSQYQLQRISKTISQNQLSMICNVISDKMQKLSSLKFQVNKQDPGFKFRMDNITHNLQNLHLISANNKIRTDISQILKSNSTFESEKYKKQEIKAYKSIQDTPESLKKKLSVSEKSILELQELKTIEFCQSITDLSEALAQQKQQSQMLESKALSKAQSKAQSRAQSKDGGNVMEYFRHRYCENSQDDD